MSARFTPQVLQDRLLDFATAVCRAVTRMPRDMVGVHVGRQLLRSATSPAANYAEARGAESHRDFIHKIQICLKELREVSVRLQLAVRLAPRFVADDGLERECSELIAIFVKSVNTAKATKRPD